MVAATSEASFLNDEVMPAAVLHHLTVIGEAISRLSDELKDHHPEVPWRQIIAVRHRIVPILASITRDSFDDPMWIRTLKHRTWKNGCVQVLYFPRLRVWLPIVDAFRTFAA